MSAHVLLNLLNDLRKKDQMRGLLSILSLSSNELNKFRSTNVRFYLSYDIKIILKSYFGVKTLGFCHMRDVKSVTS